MVGVVSKSRALLFTVCISGQWLNSLFPACGTPGRLVRAKDTQMPGAVPACAGGPASRGWRACCDLPVVAYEPLFVVVTVATMGLHLGSPGLPGHLGPVLMSVADSGSSWQPATCFWAVSMVASPTVSHSWHGYCMEPMSLRT